MPSGNETNHLLDGLTIRGGLAVGPNGPYITENDVLNHSAQNAPRYASLETFPRSGVASSNTLTSQRLQVMFWTSPVTRTITTMSFTTAGTAAATVTTIRYGIYTLSYPNATGASLTCTLAASTANDATLLAATNTEYPKALSASYTLNAGQRYGLAILVDATTAGTVACNTGTVNAGLLGTGIVPQLGTHVSAQANLPASFTCANTTYFPAYVALT